MGVGRPHSAHHLLLCRHWLLVLCDGFGRRLPHDSARCGLVGGHCSSTEGLSTRKSVQDIPVDVRSVLDAVCDPVAASPVSQFYIGCSMGSAGAVRAEVVEDEHESAVYVEVVGEEIKG